MVRVVTAVDTVGCASGGVPRQHKFIAYSSTGVELGIMPGKRYSIRQSQATGKAKKVFPIFPRCLISITKCRSKTDSKKQVFGHWANSLFPLVSNASVWAPGERLRPKSSSEGTI